MAIDRWQIDLQMMSLIQIDSCGVEAGHPFIQMKNGLRVYSFEPTKKELQKFEELGENLPAGLKPECMRAARDIVQRYFRENGFAPTPQKTQFLVPGGAFIDVGAFSGLASIKAAQRVGEQGKVVAIEASRDCFEILKLNIEANNIKNVYPFHTAATDSDGEVQLYEGGRQANTILEKAYDSSSDKVKTHEKPVAVPARRIDGILNEIGLSPAMTTTMSLEINGAEYLALKGAINFLTACENFYIRSAARFFENKEMAIESQVRELFSGHSVRFAMIAPYLHIFKGAI